MQKTGFDRTFEAALDVARKRRIRLGAIKKSLQNDDEKTALQLMRNFLGLKEKAHEQKAGNSASTGFN